MASAGLPLISKASSSLPGDLTVATAVQRAQARLATCAAATDCLEAAARLTLCGVGCHHGIRTCRCRAEAAETRVLRRGEGGSGGGGNGAQQCRIDAGQGRGSCNDKGRGKGARNQCRS